MRELLIDKYNRLGEEYDKLKEERTGRLYPGICALVGRKIYECRSSARYPTSELEEWTITHYGAILKDRNPHGIYCFPKTAYGKKPTKTIVEARENYIERYKQIPDSEFNIIFYVEKKDKIGKSSRGIIFSPGIGFEEGYYFSFDPEDFNAKIRSDQIEYEKNYAPREGYVRCERCGKQVPENEVVKYKLIYRGRDNYGKACVVSRVGTFCSGDCAMNEQMSLEG